MSLKLMSEINDNYQMAVAVHRELSDVFWFISMPGYALWNEYQYMDESMTQRKIKKYITSTYHVFTPDRLPNSANIAQPLLADKNRKSLRSEESWKIIQEAFRIYQEWEEATLHKYQKIAVSILDNGDVPAFNFVSKIIKDVKTELDYVTDKVIELSSHNWDMTQIAAEQPDYFERYNYLIKQILGKPEQFHHWNSALDVHSRVLFEKSPD